MLFVDMAMDGWMDALERMSAVCKVRDWLLALVWYWHI